MATWSLFDTPQARRHSPDGEERRLHAIEDFEAARSVAAKFKMDLRRHNRVHYSLRHERGWLLHLYPAKGRIVREAEPEVAAPFLRLPPNWNLFDVIERAARAEGENDDA